MNILVTGAGGFIGGHLVKNLLESGNEVRAVDRKIVTDWQQIHADADNVEADLRSWDSCYTVTEGVHQIYNLAADMGGMGFIESNKLACMMSSLISTHMLMAAYEFEVEKIFYSSSACVYAADRQTDPNVTALKETDAYPAEPEDGYGWEKLFSERMCRHFREDVGLQSRIARYHNVYGPWGTFTGGREKAPAAICRKVIEAKLSGVHEIEIWGDGEQTRSFMFIDDCIEGTRRIMASPIVDPINLGSSKLVTVNQLVDIVEGIAGTALDRRYNLDAPQGVRGRNSDNTLICRELGWEPSISLQDGMEATFRWIYDEMSAAY